MATSAQELAQLALHLALERLSCRIWLFVTLFKSRISTEVPTGRKRVSDGQAGLTQLRTLSREC